MFNQIRVKPPNINTAVIGAVQAVEQVGQIPLHDAVGEFKQQAAVNSPQHIQQLLVLDRSRCTGNDLIQKAQGITHTATGFTGNDPQTLKGHIAVLLVTKHFHMGYQGLGIDPAQIMPLAARVDGDRNLVRLRRREQKQDMFGGFFQSF